MGIIDKVKRKIFVNGPFGNIEGSYNNFDMGLASKMLRPESGAGIYRRYGTIEAYHDDTLATLGDTVQYFEDQYKLHKYWNISPSADGTVASPTLSLDYRWRERLLFIDISSYAVTIELPNPSEVAVGWNIKFILSEASQDEATKNFGVITHDANTDIQGYIGGGADIAITKNTSSVYWDTSDGAASGGDWCEVITDGTGWYITGQAALANSVDIANGRDVTT